MRFVQLTCMLFGLTSQYFTGDTLVSAEYGLTPIADIETMSGLRTRRRENVFSGK